MSDLNAVLTLGLLPESVAEDVLAVMTLGLDLFVDVYSSGGTLFLESAGASAILSSSGGLFSLSADASYHITRGMGVSSTALDYARARKGRY